jgi:hypothetical protein
MGLGGRCTLLPTEIVAERCVARGVGALTSTGGKLKLWGAGDGEDVTRVSGLKLDSGVGLGLAKAVPMESLRIRLLFRSCCDPVIGPFWGMPIVPVLCQLWLTRRA